MSFFFPKRIECEHCDKLLPPLTVELLLEFVDFFLSRFELLASVLDFSDSKLLLFLMFVEFRLDFLLLSGVL